jgi:GNAT superfamily N-acetyltransferase
MDTLPVAIRPLAAHELPLLESAVPRALDLHRTRFELQEEGRGFYLVAWHGEQLIGMAYLRWEGAPREPMASRLHRCPHISDLFVLPDYRSHGAGSRIMDAVEAAVRERGYSQVGLAVALDNAGARALYARRGYSDSGLGTHTIEWIARDEQGRELVLREVCDYLVKPLAQPA